MYKMVKCKLCGREYSGLELHLTSCLKKYNVTREEYTNLPEKKVPEDIKVVENEFKDEPIPTVESKGVENEFKDEPIPTVESKGVSKKEIIDNIFKGSVEKKDPNRPFSEALADYGIDEKEFGNIMKFWSGKGQIPLNMRMERRITKGKEEAARLSVNDEVNTSSLDISEALVKEHGFKVIAVKSATDKAPKTWVLRKK